MAGLGLTPFELSGWLMLFCASACWLLSVLLKEYSMTDRVWSLTPVAFAWVYLAYSSPGDVRMLAMAALVTIWGCRLTFNFWRRGGYSGMEDYRWQEVKSWMTPLQFQLLNFFFIAFYQNLLVWLLVLPCDLAWQHPTTPWGWLDTTGAVLFLTAVLGETVADQQQWDFHTEKARLRSEGKALVGDHKLGFLTHGLFRFSRHPNFFCEQCVWWAFYLLGVSAAGLPLLHWTALGPVLLTILFQSSTSLTEDLSAKKYPHYRRYQETTSRLIPFFPGPELAADGPN